MSVMEAGMTTGGMAPTHQGDLVRAVEYAVTEAEIAAAKEKYAALTADTKEGYEEVRLALGQLRGTRTGIEQRRKELKAGALEYGRRVDAAAKKLTALIEEIEEPLRLKKAAIDDAAEFARRAAEDAERLAAEAEAARVREAEEARIAMERARLEIQRKEFAEAQRVADEAAKVERERLAVERKAYEAAQAVIDAQRAEIEAKERAIREKEEAAAAAEKARLDAIRREQEAKEQAERERIAAEAKAVEEAKRTAAEAERLMTLRPDIEKINAWAGSIRALSEQAPTLLSVEGAAGIKWSVGRLLNIAEKLEGFEKKKEGA